MKKSSWVTVFVMCCTLYWGSSVMAQAPAGLAEAPAEAKTERPKTKVADEKPEAAPKDGEKQKAKPSERVKGPTFIRLRRAEDKRKTPLAMETAVVSYVTAVADKYPGVTIDLVGAVHVGEGAYYDELNQLFTTYDALLYELVAPEGTRVPKEKDDREKKGSAHPIGMLQNGLSSVLELKHQLDCVDYTKENFVHADMSPDQFSKSMEENGESWSKMFFTMMGQGIAQQAKNRQDDMNTDVLLAFMSKNRAQKLKSVFARQFENMDGQMDALNGEKGSTIINARNGKAMEVLRKELDAGKKKIGIFYGAAHLPDMETRLEKDFQFKRAEEKWILAWDLSEPVAGKKEPKK